MNANNALKLRVEELLKKENITRYKLALNSGIPHSTLKNIMSNDINDNYFSTVLLLAFGFNMTVSQFLDSPLFDMENLNI